MTEAWKPIDGFPGYEVSDLGRVRSLARVITRSDGRPRTIAPCIRKGVLNIPNGYLRVALTGGVRKLVHVLVAEAFVVGDFSLFVNHKDGVKANNKAGNLEWVTFAENVQHSYDNLVRKTCSSVQPVTVAGVPYESTLAAAKAFGVSAGTISKARRFNRPYKGMEVQSGVSRS